MRRLIPLNDFVLVRPDPWTPAWDPEQHSGVVLPDKYRWFDTKDPARRGVVVAIGPQCRLQLRPGQRVLFGKFAGQHLTVEEEEYVFVRERELLGYEPSEEEPSHAGGAD